MKLLFENWRNFINEEHISDMECRDLNVVLYVKPSNIHGKGIFAGEHIPKGTEVGISHTRRGDGWDIPPLGRYHNHSDEANCASVADGPLEKKNYSRRMIAARDISEGEELTTNYRLQPDMEQPGHWARK